MYKVTIDGKEFFAEENILLSELMRSAAPYAEHPCGGKGTCKKCTVLVNGREELSCRYKINSDIEVVVPRHGEIVSRTGELAGVISGNDTFFALDIGSTTLALAYVSEGSHKVVTATNPQRAFGADVMSRIDHCMKNGVSALQECLVSEINKMIKSTGKCSETLYVSGNATMLHTLFGEDCSGMGVAPYTPVFLESRRENAEKIGLSGVKTVISLPSVAAFVGADIVAGLYFAGLPRDGKYNLLVDLGTNAEVVLYSEKSALCTAAAAGPCFEGANISCGMSATKGAVCAFSDYGAVTIGGVPPEGICGTGLVDIISTLLTREDIDETGFFEDEVFEIAKNVYLNQQDIRQYQLAKSAVCSAIMTLMDTLGVTSEDIDKMYISGGFSAKLNIENAVKTGLLPAELSEKCVPINNSSLLGTVKFACEGGNLSEIVGRTSYVDLSANPLFTELFVENMMF